MAQHRRGKSSLSHKPVADRAGRDSASRVLETGNIYFFYRPKVSVQTVKGLEDLQRLYLVLSPRREERYRLIIIGEKRLPAVGDGGDRKSWGFVERVSSRPEDIENELDAETYVTKTRGQRQLPAARPAGEGVYAIVRHDDHTHLGYALELPPEAGEVQRALNIVDEGSYIVAVKNPHAAAGPFVGLGAKRRAKFPKSLQSRFRNRRIIPLDPATFLDFEGAEIILIGARQNVGEELGIKLNAAHETAATAEIFNDLRIEKSVHPLQPLFKGAWV